MTTLKQSQGPAGTRILALGAARGDLVVPNDDLVGPIEARIELVMCQGTEPGLRVGRDLLAGRALVDPSRQ